MQILPQYIRDQARVFPLFTNALKYLTAMFEQYGDGPKLRIYWEKNRDGLFRWYPVKMHLRDIVVDRKVGGPKFTEDHIYLFSIGGEIHTFTASADKVERLQKGTSLLENGRLEVILQV